MTEEKKIYSAWANQKQKHKKVLLVFWLIFCALLLIAAIVCLCTKEWTGAGVCGGVLLFYIGIGFLVRYASSFRRVELYADRVVFLGEASWPKPVREARYEDIVGACINAADEYGDHVRGGKWERDLDTLCVYCKDGEYILYGIQGWDKAYARQLLEEILARAGVPESEPERGEYGAESAAAGDGFAALGVEEEEEERDELYESIPPHVRALASRMQGCFRAKIGEERAMLMLLCLRGERLDKVSFEKTHHYFLEEGADDFVLLSLGEYSLCVFGDEEFCSQAQECCGASVTGAQVSPQGIVLVFKERRLLLSAQEGERIFALYWQEVPVAGAAMEQGVAFYSADEETL